MTNNYFIIYNPSSYRGKDAKLKVEEALNNKNINYTIRTTKYENQANIIANYFINNNYNNRNMSLIVIGGDGTFTEVMNSIALFYENHSKDYIIPLSLIPSGKKNNFAHNYNIPTNPSSAIKNILEKPTKQTFYIGKTLDNVKNRYHYFFDNFSIGMDALYISKTTKQKKYLSKIKKIFVMFEILYTYNSFPLTATLNSTYYVFKDAYYAYIKLNKKTQMLDFTIIEKKNSFNLLYKLFRLWSKNKKAHHDTNNFSTKSLKLFSSSLEYGQFDNEKFMSEYFNVNISITNYTLTK
ncbi:hypothetical protein GSH19_01695 [Lactobacillus sp. S2-2]|uniref:diacylglycerol/lipid kinase family protein n=1 Tax=Lactobacillus sp. S2-2 TaxID=2692917 RepID=UPI001F30D1A4|nr:diacylglycerol kinase family protein [Lactobacillus sp. S2-2]MCF6514876.1 hypothetical protein [Lactobacillus sp. S2-2]